MEPKTSSLRKLAGNLFNRYFLYLLLAIVSEVVATSLLKATEEFTNIRMTLVVLVSYLVDLYFLTLCLRRITVGVAYAIWAGLGIVLVAVFSAMLYHQVPDLPTVIGIGLILAGILTINLFSKTAIH
jgi:small multidrug resistance pump